jgi:hypothetical protein
MSAEASTTSTPPPGSGSGSGAGDGPLPTRRCFLGSSGTRVVSGDVFVAAFNAGRPPADAPLRSTLFDLAPIP